LSLCFTRLYRTNLKTLLFSSPFILVSVAFSKGLLEVIILLSARSFFNVLIAAALFLDSYTYILTIGLSPLYNLLLPSILVIKAYIKAFLLSITLSLVSTKAYTSLYLRGCLRLRLISFSSYIDSLSYSLF
jgi:hypothetical protein